MCILDLLQFKITSLLILSLYLQLEDGMELEALHNESNIKCCVKETHQ